MNNPLKYKDPSGNKLQWADLLGLIDPFYILNRAWGNNPEESWKATPTFFWSVYVPYNRDYIYHNAFEKVTGAPLNSSKTNPTSETEYTTEGCEATSLEEMVNLMYEYSKENGIEVSGYVYEYTDPKTGEVLTLYWINPTIDPDNGRKNTKSKSCNPYLYVINRGGITYVRPPGMPQGKLIAQIHTHNSNDYLYNQYDGPSFLDAKFAKNYNVPVYTIGPNSVSMIKPDSYYAVLGTETMFNNLAIGSNNPFWFHETQSWLNYPVIDENWFNF